MLTKLLNYKLYLYFIFTVLTVLIGVFVYFLIFTTAWSGVDGGFGAIGMLGYISLVAILLTASLIMKRIALKHEKATKRYLIVFWIVVITVVFAGILVALYSHMQDATHKKVEHAFERCGVSEVRWEYATRPHLVVSYSNQPAITVEEMSDPTFVSSMVKRNMMRCGAEYGFYLNGDLQKPF